MSRFQQRSKQGGVVLTEEGGLEVQDESTTREEQRGVEPTEHLHDGQVRYLPADAYTDEGELRVYTQPLSPDARPTTRTVVMARHAIHDVVTVRLVSCMEPWRGVEDGETHTAVVIRQHNDEACDVRLVDDLATTVMNVRTQFSTDTLDADARARLREYDCDIHHADNLYTERGAHVSQHAISVAQMNDGAAGGSARRHNDD